MALVSNVPQIEFTIDGLIVPNAQQVLTGVLQDFNAAFGGNLNLALTTPQGQLATSIAAIITNNYNDFAYFVNQVDPNYAMGTFQDAIGNIYFLTRKPATPTIVACLINGLAGTVIPAGTLAQAQNKDLYAAVDEIIIPVGGSITADFENVIPGRIACAANTLNIVYQTVIGWDTINNPTDGLPGQNVESRQQFEYRRRQSVAFNALGTNGAVKAKVFAIPEVIDCFVYDNYRDTSYTYGGVTLVRHSIYVCAYVNVWTNALRQTVANAIWLAKDTGCSYNGATTVTVYNGNIPYDVKFQEAAPLQIYFVINITSNPRLPTNIAYQIQNAIFENFDEKIGDNVQGNNFYGTILAVNPLIQIVSVFVGDAPSPVTTSIQAEITEQPLVSITNIVVNLV